MAATEGRKKTPPRQQQNIIILHDTHTGKKRNTHEHNTEQGTHINEL